ncbi:MAG: GNAT family N-acetyltransferase [Gemmatimonadaceae bacterium]
MYELRKATADDHAALADLIARSARKLGADAYTPEQIDGALRGAFGVDSQLVRDGTYFVAEADGRIVGCGGWSRRHTLFGGDTHTQRDAAELEPGVDAAKIRAFFVDPDHARKGIGRAILERCESEALAAGFTRFELMATLPGVRLYSSLGYVPGPLVHQPLGAGLTIELVPMSKAAPEREP